MICIISLEVSTNENWQYVYYPLNETTIQFKVKAHNDAHVMFTEKELPNGEVDNFPFLEVIIIFNNVLLR